ncbi:hypothetical protein [Streptomyces sp. SID3343]|uniref:hypothetical protein n=1 Tax=Streptomyces sp. SID3343 TaxID=2690260 RepID=UPI001F2E75E9|nr:hypothetical protein [Streptomyces sp. SID3343]
MGVGSRFRYDGETVEVIELAITVNGNEAVLKDGHGRLMRLAVRELLLSDRACVIPDGPGPSSDDDEDVAGVVLSQLSEADQEEVRTRAAMSAKSSRVTDRGFRSWRRKGSRDRNTCLT